MAAGRDRGADFAKLRIDRANARMNAPQDDSQDAQKPDDPVTRLRDRADTMATTAAAMKQIADAADPLYKTLDDGQKRRLAVLTHMDGRFGGGGWRHREFMRGMDRDDGDRGRGYDRDPAATGTAGRAGTGCRRRSGSELASRSDQSNISRKPPDSGGFLIFLSAGYAGETPSQLAGHRGVALLNDALLRRLSGPSSGRIAQLVEQMTLNHRVPGSSPGAPTKLFKDLAV